jgi:hypothetical protein
MVKPKGQPDDKSKPKFMQWLDVLVKLTVPLGAIGAAILANHIKNDISTREILVQREQSESELRATMFGHLISPILGGSRDNALDPDKERLLVELLALNFHEHFEFKPLLLHADEQLRYLTRSRVKGITDRQNMTDEDARQWIDSRRDSLESVATRVRERQLAVIGAPERKVQCANSKKGGGDSEVRITLYGSEFPGETLPEQENPPSQFVRQFTKIDNTSYIQKQIEIISPNCETKLDISFKNPDWSEGNVKVYIDNTRLGANEPSNDFDFTITPFDLPLTDNTLLANRNRFAIAVVDHVKENDEEGPYMYIQLVWFPLEYFPPRERPTDYKEISSLLDLKTGQ